MQNYRRSHDEARMPQLPNSANLKVEKSVWILHAAANVRKSQTCSGLTCCWPGRRHVVRVPPPKRRFLLVSRRFRTARQNSIHPFLGTGPLIGHEPTRAMTNDFKAPFLWKATEGHARLKTEVYPIQILSPQKANPAMAAFGGLSAATAILQER